MLSRRVLVAGALAVATSGPASAQPAAPHERLTVSLSAGALLPSGSLDVTARHPIYLESAVVDTSYKYRFGTVFDGGLTYRLARGFGVGVAASWYSQPKDVAVSAAIPHPFFFQTPRTVSGTAAGARRDVAAAHFEALYSFRAARRVDVTVGAGPAFFRVRQTIVDDVSYRDAYPYDAPSFTAASTQRISGHTAGFGGSLDIAMRISRRVGLGAVVRASNADVQFATSPTVTATTTQAGGVHGAGGVRLYF
jgi:hypothetical protein